ncbi:Ig-like repeat protein Blp2 [Acinetobacter sp. NIPH 2699]|uniref:Ig-like repeat protein Blp2 n=1 Tax=Acinetobacter sp. NIPH 2699 TaxID=2923433 RepID=UPI001F4A12D5|nr:Ig-like repeat protein Blp2 [Acinetobacter sp. NIPH 2699]MCH7336873.1 Ig-like repeat protein Blp2 [Acinetobacter sp. NIPH 2699]
MTKVVVSSKKNLITLQDAQMQDVILNQPSIVQIGITQADIKSMMKQGDDLVITLKSGEKIVISGFYNDVNVTEHTLALVKEDGTYEVAQFDEAGKFIRYVPTTQLTQFAYSAVPTQTPMDGVDDSGISKSQLMKAGLVALAAEGVYLWAVKDDDKDKNNNKSPDITPPATPTATLSSDTQTITGKTEAKAKILIRDLTGKVIATGQADDQGNYTIKLDQPLVNGNKVSVVAVDQAGNTSQGIIVTGNKDTIAPEAPTAQLNADGTIVTGKTEANAKVSIFDADGNLLGTVKANKEGLYSIPVSPPLSSEQGGTVISEDAAGNKSEPSKVVAGKDTVAPEQPLIEVNKEGTSIHGKAEANAKVIIKDADGNVIGSGTVDAQGKFEVNIAPALATGEKGSIIIEDAAGNQSKPVEISAGKDTIAPDQAVVQISADGDSVSGTAEANAKIEIRSVDGKIIGTGTVGADGKFTVAVSPALTDKNIGKVYVIDAAGNRSVEANIIGDKDTIAPTKPILEKVVDDVGDVKGAITAGGSTDDARPTLSGRGEAKAVLTIYDNGQPIGTVTVGNDGKWSFELSQDLALGSHNITLTQTDAAGNTSEISDSFSFTVVAPTTANTFADIESAGIDHAEIALIDSVDLATLLTGTESITPSFDQFESIVLEEVLIPSDPQSNQLDEVLDQLMPEDIVVPPDTSVLNTELSSIHTDFSQAIKSDPFALLETLQHPII